MSKLCSIKPQTLLQEAPVTCGQITWLITFTETEGLNHFTYGNNTSTHRETHNTHSEIITGILQAINRVRVLPFWLGMGSH